MATDYRTCPRCGRSRPIVNFALNRARKSGFQVWCRDCNKAHWRQNRRHPQPGTVTSKAPPGRPPAPRRRRQIQGTPTEQVIVALLKHTLWPQRLIAQVARVSMWTMRRIVKDFRFEGRVSVSLKALRWAAKVPATRVFFDHLLRLEIAHPDSITAKTVREAVISCADRRNKVRDAVRKRNLRRLNPRTRAARKRLRTKMNEPLSYEEMVLAACILLVDPPSALVTLKGGRRVFVWHDDPRFELTADGNCRCLLSQ